MTVNWKSQLDIRERAMASNRNMLFGLNLQGSSVPCCELKITVAESPKQAWCHAWDMTRRNPSLITGCVSDIPLGASVPSSLGWKTRCPPCVPLR